MPRAPSRADEDLAHRLRAAGLDADARRVQRLRIAGLILRPDRDFPGGGGSGGRYSAESFAQAEEAIELDDKYPRTRYLAVIAMYARGRHRVDEAKLKRAMTKALDRQEREIRAGAAPGADAAQAAAEAGPVLAQRLKDDPSTLEFRRRLRRGKEPRLQRLSLVGSDLAMLALSGELMTLDGAQHLFDFMGLSQVHEALQTASPPPDPLDYADLFAAMSIPERRKAVANATLTQLDNARTDTLVPLKFSHRARELLTNLGAVRTGRALPEIPVPDDMDLAIALGAITMLAFRRRNHESYESHMAETRVGITLLEAIAAIAEHLDPRFRGLLLTQATEADPDFVKELERILPKIDPKLQAALRYNFGKK